jgi:hypothetical protein
MAVTAGDALLERPGALGIGGEEVGAVVGLDDDDVALAELLADVLRGVAEVGEVGEGTARGKKVVGVAVGETKTDGLLSVVRDGEGVDFEIAETEAGAGFEELPRGAMGGVEFRLHGATGGRIGEDLDVRMFLQAVDGGGVIPVFVREKNGVDAFEGFAGVGEEGGEFAGGEAGIDEDARTFGHEQRGVARTAGTEDAEAHGHIE